MVELDLASEAKGGSGFILSALLTTIHRVEDQLNSTNLCELNMSVSGDVSEADVVFNRASLALAKSQRLIASWLPPQPREATAAKSEADLDKEEVDIFSPVPELYDFYDFIHFLCGR